MLAWDTETCPIRPPVQAPPLVVVSWARSDEEGGLVSWRDAEPFMRKVLSQPSTTFNGVYDLAVVGNAYKSLIPVIFDALANDLVCDVMLRQKLLDNARGRLSKPSSPTYYRRDGKAWKVVYNLSCTHDRLCGSRLEKDMWRLRYAEFRDVPIAQWPDGAKHYALEDAFATRRCHVKQDEADIDDFLADQFRQHRAYWALHLMRCWGIRTDEAAIRKLDERLLKQYEKARAACVKAGLIRKSGTRNMKLVKARMFEALGEQSILTDKGQLLYEVELEKWGDDLSKEDKKEIRLKILKSDDHKYVSTNSESCQMAAEEGHEEMTHYHDFVHTQKLRSTYVAAYWGGTVIPIQSRFEPILETGRTSSSGPNIQNLPREKGLREVFVPRKGCVFAACDYDLAELRSLAQVCYKVLGYSKLGDALNKGHDPHLAFAAQMLGIEYAEAKRRKGLSGKTPEDKALKDQIKEYRTLAKAANFGFPGGLGVEAFIKFAKGAYGIKMTTKEVRKLKSAWFRQWSEMREYFEWINSHFEQLPPKLDPKTGKKKRQRPKPCTLEQLFSGRVRGGCRFTQAANTYFQGLTADAAKEALWLITREQFTNPDSVLYGTHIVNFVHDEIIIECPEAIGHEVAMEMRRLMVEAYNRWTPDVPMTATPHLMRRWIKEAEPRWRDGGMKGPAGEDDRLIPFDDEMQEAA